MNSYEIMIAFLFVVATLAALGTAIGLSYAI
jgi:hypothetical protein